jgi:hypothetical protein
VTDAEARERAAAMLADAGIVLTAAASSSYDDVFTDPRIVR